MPNTYYFPKSAFRRIKGSARLADLHELCYVVLGRGGRVSKVVRIPNRAKDTTMRHLVADRDVQRVRRRESVSGLSVLGFLHTHPASTAEPGPGDLAGYADATLLFIYADVYEELRAFRVTSHSPGYVEKAVRLV